MYSTHGTAADAEKKNSKTNKLGIAYLVLALPVETAALIYLADMGFWAAKAHEDVLMLLPFILVAILYIVITISTFRNTIKGQKPHPIRNSILLKICTYFLLSAFAFIRIPNGVYAFGLFLFIGIVFSLLALAVIKSKRRKPVQVTMPMPLDTKFQYNGKNLWKRAAREYMRLHNIQDIGMLSEEEKRRIRDYTAVYYSYFFYWLASEGFLSETFYTKTKITPDYITEMVEKRTISPVAFVREIDYYFDQTYLLEGTLPFFKSYFDHGSRFTGTVSQYLMDFMDTNGNPVDRFFCIDFSWEILDKLVKKIGERYDEHNRKLNRYNLVEFYEEEDENTAEPAAFHSTLFGSDLETKKTGPKYTGDISEQYIRQCMENMEHLSELQLRRLRRWLNDMYGSDEETGDLLSQFRAYSLEVMDPKVEGDIVYVVSGEADFEPEHGISFSVRNGVIVEQGYAFDFPDLYDDEHLEKYERLCDSTDYTKIRTVQDMERLAEAGILKKVSILPDITGDVTFTKELSKPSHQAPELLESECIYLPAYAAATKELFEKNLKSIITMENANEVTPKITYNVQFSTDAAGNLESSVPRDIYIHCRETGILFRLSCLINVWD
ncbi:MAG: hypothetical protein KBT01_02800 [Clostridiales bacterium]|nr:hypothetical protein [Candidatus Blautia equi]